MSRETSGLVSPKITIVTGIPLQFRQIASEIYFDAFEKKIGKILGGKEKAVAYMTKVMDPNFAICAFAETEKTRELIGIAGFKTANGSLIGGGFAGLVISYGFFPALFRTLFLLLLEREIEPGILLMDGIAVTKEQRGLGAGSKLLDAIARYAKSRGYAQVRLDVIDQNPRARALYERKGFKAIEVEQTGPFKHLFGFSSSTKMVLKL